MSLIPGFSNPRDLFEKLKRDAQKLDTSTSADSLFNFVITAWHLQEWVENGPAQSDTRLRTAIRDLRDADELQICRSLANSSKHFKLRPGSDAGVTGIEIEIISEGAIPGRMRPGYIVLGSVPQEEQVISRNGSRVRVNSFVTRVIAIYEDFFMEHQL